MADSKISHVIFYNGSLALPQTNLLRNQLAFLNQPAQAHAGVAHLPCNGLLIVISSWGGNTFEMRSLYALIRSLPFPVEIHATGVMKSAAVPLMLAADRRTAAPHTSFLFHPWTWGTEANPSHTLDELKQLSMHLEDDIDWAKKVLVERTRLTAAEINEFGWFEKASFEDANFALKHGLIHAVTEIKIPAGVMTWNIA